MAATASLEAVRLRSGFDVALLRRDLAEVSRRDWSDKTWYSSEDGPGAPASDGWKCLPLRSPGGEVSRTDPGGPGTVGYAYTPVIEHVPYIRDVLREVPGNHRSIEFLALAPGSASPVHRDFPSGLAFGWVRLHLPITTGPECTITINGNRHHWEAGSLWYGDVSQPHHVANGSGATRVHLIIDVEVTPEAMRIFPGSFLDAFGRDRILYNRPELPLPAGHGLRRTFRVPSGEYLFTDEPWKSSPGDSCPAVITPGAHGRPEISTGDGFRATLVHTGANTFRYLGWTDAHTLTIGPRTVRWRFQDGSGPIGETEIAAPPEP